MNNVQFDGHRRFETDVAVYDLDMRVFSSSIGSPSSLGGGGRV